MQYIMYRQLTQPRSYTDAIAVEKRENRHHGILARELCKAAGIWILTLVAPAPGTSYIPFFNFF